MIWKIVAGVLGVSLVALIVWIVQFLTDFADGFGSAFGYPTKRRRRG